MGTKRLADAVRQAKIAAAQRADVVVDIREADRARLEILAEELQSLIDELPPGDELFDFSISGGMHPRLWIDGTANVIMARDRRTYRLVRETRLGRVTLVETAEPRVMTQHVTAYVAERIVERDKAFAVSDGLNERVTESTSRQSGNGHDAPLRQPETRTRGTDFIIAATWMTIGIVIGAGLLLAIASYQGMSIG